jgi:hypothetical protein
MEAFIAKLVGLGNQASVDNVMFVFLAAKLALATFSFSRLVKSTVDYIQIIVQDS